MYKTMSRNMQRRRDVQRTDPRRKKHRTKRKKLLSASVERQRRLRPKIFGMRLQRNVTVKDFLKRVSSLPIAGTLTPDQKQGRKDMSRDMEDRYPAPTAERTTKLLCTPSQVRTFKKNRRKMPKEARHKKWHPTISGGLPSLGKRR